jgi:hypothetical protein
MTTKVSCAASWNTAFLLVLFASPLFDCLLLRTRIPP